MLPQLDTSQVVLNKVYGKDSGTAVEFYALFSDATKAQRYVDAFNSACGRPHAACILDALRSGHALTWLSALVADAETVKQVFSRSSLFNKNPRVISAQRAQRAHAHRIITPSSLCALY
jgi:hypothetical protein